MLHAVNFMFMNNSISIQFNSNLAHRTTDEIHSKPSIRASVCICMCCVCQCTSLLRQQRPSQNEPESFLSSILPHRFYAPLAVCSTRLTSVFFLSSFRLNGRLIWFWTMRMCKNTMQNGKYIILYLSRRESRCHEWKLFCRKIVLSIFWQQINYYLERCEAFRI